MGKINRANCQKCGFVKENISIGSGMRNYKYFEGYPYSCNWRGNLNTDTF